MKIIRYRDGKGSIGHAADKGDGTYFAIAGDLFDSFRVTDQKADVSRLMAPIVPSAIWCIGQNYRRHAQEVGMAIPENPVVFAKGVNSIQDPGAPILIPTSAHSDEVDYECELVV